MKVRNKGKVYPSPSSSSYSPDTDALSIFKLLPATILALASVLSLQDREVLAYMITRSIKTTNPSSVIEEKKKNTKKSNTHNSPLFNCDCFDCYTSYWFRWDSSPNRELIHQAIEAFEEHLNNGEQSKINNNRSKKREKMGRRVTGKHVHLSEVPSPEREVQVLQEIEDSFIQVLPEKADLESENGEAGVVEAQEGLPEDEEAQPDTVVLVRDTAMINHKGLARKVLPDVLGLFNSRLWSLWGPNV